MEIGRMISEIRKSRGMTQFEVAIKAGIRDNFWGGVASSPALSDG